MDLETLYRPTPDAPSLSLDRIYPEVPPRTIWEGLFDPRQAARVWFGSTLETDLRPGGLLKWTGVWEGKSFEDHGIVLACEDAKSLDCLYFSGWAGRDETPETRMRLTIRLEPAGSGTKVRVEQANFADATSRDHSIQGWNAILDAAAREIPGAA